MNQESPPVVTDELKAQIQAFQANLLVNHYKSRPLNFGLHSSDENVVLTEEDRSPRLNRAQRRRMSSDKQ